APWWLLPGNAAYRSPGRTRRESCVTPVTSRGPSGPAKGSARARVVITTPSSSASSGSGRPGTLRGRRSAGTGRGYRRSRRRERDVRALAVIRWNLEGLQGEVHHLVEGGSGHAVAEVVGGPRVLHVDRDHDLRVAGRRHPDVAGPVVAL